MITTRIKFDKLTNFDYFLINFEDFPEVSFD